MRKSTSNAVVGARFGRLLVIGDAPRTGRNRLLLCRCDCGVEKPVLAHSLSTGDTRSCGCAKREAIAKTGRANRKHGGVTGGRRSPTYITWQSMLLRCDNPRTNGYANYGGRGIKVCPEWRDFAAFLSDMGERPEGMTLDRIETDGDYCLENCRWADAPAQYANKRGTRTVTHDGRTLTVAEWARVTGMHRNTILRRLNKGATAAEALAT